MLEDTTNLSYLFPTHSINRYYEEYWQVHDRRNKDLYVVRIEELKSAWAALKSFSENIQCKIKLVDRIILFGDSMGINVEGSSKKEIVFSVPYEDEKLKGSFDFSACSIDGINDYTNSLINPEILNGLNNELMKENSILIQCHEIAMLILVRDLNCNHDYYTALADAIGRELVQIDNFIAICSANITKEKYYMTLRMYRHENSHIATRLMAIINRYFENSGKRFLEANNSKRELICNGMKNAVQYLANMTDNIGFITVPGLVRLMDESDITQVDVVEMLKKWQVMFRDELEVKNLNINTIQCETYVYRDEKKLLVCPTDITRKDGNYRLAPKEIMIQGRAFELLVYNLIDNAVKHAYRGTNIYLIWSQIENEYELSVTSYGPRMSEGDSMYGLYVLGEDSSHQQEYVLGLFVAKEIAEMIGLKIDHDSEKISNYNVPLVPWYINMSLSTINNYSKISERELTLHDDAQQAVFAVNENDDTRIREMNSSWGYLQNSIKKETWRTTFRVTIPIQSK